MAVAALFVVPAVLLWLAHQHVAACAPLVTLAVVTSLLLAGVWTGASRVYAHYFGPAHPSSSLQLVPVDRVVWSWAEGVDRRVLHGHGTSG